MVRFLVSDSPVLPERSVQLMYHELTPSCNVLFKIKVGVLFIAVFVPEMAPLT